MIWIIFTIPPCPFPLLIFIHLHIFYVFLSIFHESFLCYEIRAICLTVATLFRFEWILAQSSILQVRFWLWRFQLTGYRSEMYMYIWVCVSVCECVSVCVCVIPYQENCPRLETLIREPLISGQTRRGLLTTSSWKSAPHWSSSAIKLWYRKYSRHRSEFPKLSFIINIVSGKLQ